MTAIFKPRNRALAQPLETERFHLRPVGPVRFLIATNRWRSDPDILTGLYQSPRLRSLWKWIRTGPVPNNRTRFAFLIVPKGSNVAIGAHTTKLQGYRSAFNAVALDDRDWWGKGVVVEVRAHVMNHFFRNGEIDRFFGVVEARNVASIFNYRRLGYDHVGTWHRHRQNPVTGEVLDFLNFEILGDKWEEGPFAEKRDAD